MCFGHPIGYDAAGGQEPSLLPDRCLGHSPTQAQSQAPASPCSMRKGMYRAWRRNGLRTSGLFPTRKAKSNNLCRKAEEMIGGTGTCKTGRWLNSFRLASEQALITEPAEILRTQSQRHLPREAKGDRTGGTSSGRRQDEAQESWSCRRCRERFAGPLGNRQ